MKEITIKKGIVIKTPFLKPAEAAAFCGLARSTFELWGKELPWSGNAKNKRYHTDDLIAWMRGKLDVPFGGVLKSGVVTRKPPKRHHNVHGIRNPWTGKVLTYTYKPGSDDGG